MPPLNSSYLHQGSDFPLIGDTIPQWLARVTAAQGGREAVVSRPQARRLSYRQLADQVDQLARALLGLGFNRGDRIGIWSTNNIEWLLLQLATARIGVILVNINPAYRSHELAYALQRSEVQGLFLIPAFRSSDYLAMLLELLPELRQAPPGEWCNARFPHLRRVVLYDPRNPEATAPAAPGMNVWRDLLEAAEAVSGATLEAATAALDRDDPINIQYTSGTTGSPKAVLLSHHNLINNAWFAAQGLQFGPDDRLCVSVPFYHCFGMVLCNLLALSVGACVVIPCEHFDPLQVLETIEAERCTALHGVPTMFIAELDHPRFSRFDLGSLRTGIISGAPCAPELLRRLTEQMHCGEILVGYGQTEASPLTHLSRPDSTLQQRTETVGINLPHQEVKLVSTESGQTVPIGAVGEVCYRGYHVMRGYYGDAEATAQAIDPAGWLHSGDLGVMQADGYLRITGRLKEMIIRGGENIYPREIEDFLFTHPKIASAAVFSLPDPFYGEEVVAWIKLRAGEQASEAEIRDYCKQRIAHFKVPKQIRFVDEFPMTVTGKLQKFRMRELMLAETDQTHII
ncbi:AMP-binding protein [Sedimenticola hydrogenitrophicus]|uniref:AMP-binding protein n=1 Tax=Sedimenticola hydrogenitrophicus TaxID=2967975 RepID=UPI0021A653CC|nr:AMP-binding protein [Sedimenticola hydrogenitrophicus]